MIKTTIKKKGTSSIITAIMFLFIFCSISQAQNNKNNQSMNRKYVRMDIGHGAMHCPFLSPKLEAKLKEISGIENLIIDRVNSFGSFDLPFDTEMTAVSLKQIGIDAGYPAADVEVAIENKPIKRSGAKQ